MDARVLAAVRIGLLVLILGFFLISLVVGIRDERQRGNLDDVSRQGYGTDLGIRVRLWNDRELLGSDVAPRKPEPDFTEVVVTLRQPGILWCPGDGAESNQERRYVLKAGATVRVLLGTSGMTISLPRQQPATENTWSTDSLRLQPLSKEADPTRPASFDPRTQKAPDRLAWMTIGQHAFRGSLDIIRLESRRCAVVNILPIEAYLEGVLAVEMGAAYPLEALKAQAILARSVAFSRVHQGRVNRTPFDLGNTTNDQRYVGQGSGAAVIRRAVSETRGITVLGKGGVPFEPLYHASSGGYTANIEQLRPGARDLRGQWPLGQTVMNAVPDPYCRPAWEALGRGASHGEHTVVLSAKDMRMALAPIVNATGRTLGIIRSLRVKDRDPLSQRVLTLVIGHAPNEEFIISGHAFRMAMGPQVVHSTLWGRDAPRLVNRGSDRELQWEIQTFGWGHGVGMSQISAGYLANQGHNARSILRIFYGPDLALRQWW